MSRFENRLKSLEKNFPVPSVNSFLEALTDGEMQALLLAMHRQQLANARAAGDKSLASDLALVVKYDSAKLRQLPKQDRPSPKKTNQLINELLEAEDDGAELFRQRDDIEDDFRKRMKKRAADIRFRQEFADLFEQLEAGNIVEHLDETQMPVAGARMLPENGNNYWRTVELISPYLPARREYVDPRQKHKDDDEVWRPWRQYCLTADQKRRDILAGKIVPAPAAIPVTAPPVKPAPSAITAAPTPPTAQRSIKDEPPAPSVHEMQRLLRNRSRPS